MMEMVQITGQAGNGQYYDNKGRLLYAMGDINIVPGMWVWTNGKTIYGHQTAGEQPINFSLRGILPCLQGNEVMEITDDGELKPFIYVPGIIAYVGDRTHAYVAIDSGGDWSIFDWYNLLTGEKLGSFAADEACVDPKTGDLLAIKAGEASYSKTGSKVSKTAKYCEIRRNGKLINNIDFANYQSVLEKVENEQEKVNQLNPNPKSDRPEDELSASTRTFTIRLYPNLDYTALCNSYANCVTYPAHEYVSADVVYFNYPDKSKIPYGEVVGLGFNIPYDPVKSLSEYVGVDLRTIMLYDVTCYYKFIKNTYKFRKAYATVTTFISADQREIATKKDKRTILSDSMSISVAKFPTTYTFENAYKPNFSGTVQLLNGYDEILGICKTSSSVSGKGLHTHVTASAIEQNKSFISLLPNDIVTSLAKVYLSAGFILATSQLIDTKDLGSLARTTFKTTLDNDHASQLLNNENNSTTKVFDLNDGYKARVHIQPRSEYDYFPYSVNSVDVLDASGKIITTLDYDKLNAFNLLYNAYWLNLRVAKLRSGKYVIFSSYSTNTGKILICDDDNIEVTQNQQGTFSAIPFFNRDLLKRRLQIIKDVV